LLVPRLLAPTTRGGRPGDDRGLRPRGADRGPHPNRLGAARPRLPALRCHLPRPSQVAALEAYPDPDDGCGRRHGVAPLRGHVPARGAAAAGAGERLGGRGGRRGPPAGPFLREELLPRGRVSGWAPGWFAGVPMLTFYFPLPYVLIAALTLPLGDQVAFKLVTVVRLLLLPMSCWASFRLGGLG